MIKHVSAIREHTEEDEDCSSHSSAFGKDRIDSDSDEEEQRLTVRSESSEGGGQIIFNQNPSDKKSKIELKMQSLKKTL